MRLMILVCCSVALISFGECDAQTVTYLTDCARGASFVANATIRQDGSILLVGDLGRVGTYAKSIGRIEWECLPTQSFLYDVWSHADTTIVVGADGHVWYRIAAGRWTAIPIPNAETLRAVAVHAGEVFVGSETGSIWRKENLGSASWSLSLQAHGAIIDLLSYGNMLLAVGRKGALYEKRALWLDLSLPNSTLEFASIAVIGDVYIIGADSGKAFRYERDNTTWQPTQILRPSNHTEIDDFRGRDDKTLCIAQGPGTTLLATGYYFAGPNSEQGVHVSNDTGKTWQLKRFYDDPYDPDIINPAFCPIVGYRGDSIIAVACSPESPTTVFVTDSSMATWTVSLQSEDIYRRLDTVILYVRGRCSTIVNSAVVMKPGSEYLTLQSDLATSAQFQSAVKPISYIVSVYILPDTVIHDTIAILNGRYASMFKLDEVIYVGGDSGRIATSVNGGLNWSISQLSYTNGKSFSIGRFFLDENRLCALSFGPANVASGWKTHGIVELSDSGWHLSRAIPPPGHKANVIDFVVDKNGRSAILGFNVDDNDNFFYTVYRYRNDSVAYTETAQIRIEDMSGPDIFFSGDTIGVTAMVGLLSGAFGACLRCLWINDEWLCDTAAFKTPSYDSILPGGAFPYNDVGYALLGYHSRVGAIVSFDHGLNWEHLPQQPTFFGHTLRFAVADGMDVLVGGSNSYLALFSFDSTLTSIIGTSRFQNGQRCHFDLTLNNGQPVPCELYDMQGRLITTVMYYGPSSLSEDRHLVPGRIYVLAPLTDTNACPFLFLR